jgi:hypothetical protein
MLMYVGLHPRLDNCIATIGSVGTAEWSTGIISILALQTPLEPCSARQ